MTEHTEKHVLMKCKQCGYEERVPEWLLLELNPNPKKIKKMMCPECNKTMVDKKAWVRRTL